MPEPVGSAWAGAVALATSALAEVARTVDVGSDRDESPESILSMRSSFTGWTPSGQTAAGGATRLLAAGDGWVAVALPRPDDLELLPAWLGVDGPAAPGAEPPWPAVEGAIGTRAVADVVGSGQELGLAVAAVPDATARVDEQLEARGTVAANRPYRVDAVAPVAGARPVVGARVVDLSSLWAGPLCARLLGRAGASVLKVESTTRPDGARLGDPSFYAWLHADQEERAVPLATPGGVDQLRDLVAGADVVIEGSRPRALARMGIDPAAVVAENPGTVWVAITAYGRSGPWRNRVGFGDDAAAAGGLVERADDQTPSFVGDAVADPLAGVVAAALVGRSLAAGGGAIVDVALREVARCAAAGGHVEW